MDSKVLRVAGSKPKRRTAEDPPPALESVETDEPREPFSEQPWLVTRSASSGEIRSSPGKPSPGQTWFLPDHPWALRAALVASQSLLFSLIMVSLTEARRAEVRLLRTGGVEQREGERRERAGGERRGGRKREVKRERVMCYNVNVLHTVP